MNYHVCYKTGNETRIWILRKGLGNIDLQLSHPLPCLESQQFSTCHEGPNMAVLNESMASHGMNRTWTMARLPADSPFLEAWVKFLRGDLLFRVYCACLYCHTLLPILQTSTKCALPAGVLPHFFPILKMDGSLILLYFGFSRIF